MKAVIVNHSSPDRLVLGDVEGVAPGPSDAVVRMVATSLNLGETRRALFAAPDGSRPGWDVAGTVECAAADGSGPRDGARVTGFVESGAWAERVVIPARRLAVIPDKVSFAQAATLPVAGLTAYYALAQGGLLAGKRVLVNGASGGVGHIACQIARASAAHVVGVARRQEALDQIRGHGVDVALNTVRLLDAQEFGPYDVIVESVGGQALADALAMLRGDGVCVTLGDAGEDPAEFHPRPFFRAGSTRLYGLFVYEEVHRHPPAPVLERLLALIGSGGLLPTITCESDWSAIAPVARDLVERRIQGKAVLVIS